MADDPRFRRWTFAEAREWYAEHEDSVKALGWALSLCGSVVRDGEGRDLDVVAVPIASNAHDLVALWDESEWAHIWVRERSPTGVEARVYETFDNQVIDMMFLPRRAA